MAHKTSNKGGEKNTAPPPGDHNFAKLSEVVQNSMKKLWDAEQSEKQAILKHVQSFRDDKKQIKADMKASTEGMEVKDFNLWYNIYKRQQDAKLNMDETDRKRVLTNIAVIFDAVTGQGCMIDCILDMKSEETADGKVDVKSPDDLPGDDAEETSESDEDGPGDGENTEETAEEATEDSGDDSDASEETQL